MKKKIDFYWFSGSGNTLLVVQKVTEVFRESGHQVRMLPIRESTRVEITRDKCIGIGVPVAEQGTYPFVWRFLKNLPDLRTMEQWSGESEGIEGEVEVFFVDTLLAYSGGIVGPLKNILLRKGYSPIGAKEILMPNNLFPRQIDVEKEWKKQARGIEKARDFAQALTDGSARWRKVPLLPWFWTAMNWSKKIWQWMRRWAALSCDPSRCTRCSLCEKLCPVGNIRLDPYPVFADRCEVCLRCYALCPEGAIISPKRKDRAHYRAVSAREMLSAERQ